ncbi:DDE-type integrase/transposase/recombinase [Chloroflexota bacterium]
MFRAIEAKRPTEGRLHHSDQGSQYCSHEYRNFMDRFGLKVSMSRKGNCFDNAVLLKFFIHLFVNS